MLWTLLGVRQGVSLRLGRLMNLWSRAHLTILPNVRFICV